MIVALFDAGWLCFCYGLVYRAFSVALSDHASVLRAVIGVEIRYFHYSEESGDAARHSVLHLLTSAVVFVTLAANPVLQTLIFALLGFADAVLLNRIVLNLELLRILARDARDLPPASVACVALTAIGYSSRAMVLPAAFHIVDSLGDAPDLVARLQAVHLTLLAGDTGVSRALRAASAAMATRRVLIARARAAALIAILAASLSFTTSLAALPFYYYAAARIADAIELTN